MKNLHRRKKGISVPLSKIERHMIAYGGQDEIFIPININNIVKFAEFKFNHFNKEELIETGSEALRKDREEVWIKDNQYNLLMIADLKNITIGPGNPRWGIDPKETFIILKIDNLKIL